MVDGVYMATKNVLSKMKTITKQDETRGENLHILGFVLFLLNFLIIYYNKTKPNIFVSVRKNFSISQKNKNTERAEDFNDTWGALF